MKIGISTAEAHAEHASMPAATEPAAPQRRLLLWGAASVGMVFVLVGIWFSVRPADIPAVAARRRTLKQQIHAPGHVETTRSVLRVPAPAAGIVRSVEVRESQEVAAGAPLVILQDDEAHAQLQLAQADVATARANERRLLAGARREEVAQAQARLAEAQTGLAAARDARTRADALFANQSITRAAHDEARRNEEVAASREEQAKKAFDLVVAGARAEDIRAAHATVEASEARLSIAQLQIAGRTIRAPFAGTVLALFAHPGEAVAPAQAVAQLADLSTLQIRAEVDELNMGVVQVGQKACAHADALPGEEYCGAVTSVACSLGRRHFEAGNPGGATQDVKIVEITSSLPSVKGTRLIDGMAVELVVEAAAHEGVIAVPLAAVRQEKGKAIVKVRTAAGAVVDREVELGATDGMYREITRGLESGERVVIEP